MEISYLHDRREEQPLLLLIYLRQCTDRVFDIVDVLSQSLDISLLAINQL